MISQQKLVAHAGQYTAMGSIKNTPHGQLLYPIRLQALKPMPFFASVGYGATIFLLPTLRPAAFVIIVCLVDALQNQSYKHLCWEGFIAVWGRWPNGQGGLLPSGLRHFHGRHDGCMISLRGFHDNHEMDFLE